jgi:hypothetical protein
MTGRNMNGTRDPTVTAALDSGSHINVRLQARAARGASPCKPLFGGNRT